MLWGEGRQQTIPDSYYVFAMGPFSSADHQTYNLATAPKLAHVPIHFLLVYFCNII